MLTVLSDHGGRRCGIMTGEIFASIEFRRDKRITPSYVGIVARIKPGMEGTPYNNAFSELIKLDGEFKKIFKKFGLDASFFVEYDDSVKGVE
jgi:hypothetical protein